MKIVIIGGNGFVGSSYKSSNENDEVILLGKNDLNNLQE